MARLTPPIGKEQAALGLSGLMMERFNIKITPEEVVELIGRTEQVRSLYPSSYNRRNL